jgi:hypothetical protein
MNAMDDLNRLHARWRAAEPGPDVPMDDGPDDAADAAFGALFTAAVPPVRVPGAFAAETMQAVSRVAAEDTVRARRTRRVLGVGSVAASLIALYFGSAPALALLSSLFVTTLDVLVATVVWFASSADSRPDLWSVIGNMGRAAGAFVSDPKVTIVLLTLQGIAIAAFIGLQRLLNSGPEYYK